MQTERHIQIGIDKITESTKRKTCPIKEHKKAGAKRGHQESLADAPSVPKALTCSE